MSEGLLKHSLRDSTLQFVDRVIVLRINTEEREVETLLDLRISEALQLMTPAKNGERFLSTSAGTQAGRPRSTLDKTKEVQYGGFVIRELESGTIEVERDGNVITPTKPALREIAQKLNIGILTGSGSTANVRQLGSRVIRTIQALQSSE